MRQPGRTTEYWEIPLLRGSIKVIWSAPFNFADLCRIFFLLLDVFYFFYFHILSPLQVEVQTIS